MASLAASVMLVPVVRDGVVDASLELLSALTREKADSILS